MKKSIQVVSFNANEAAAVDRLLSDIADPLGSPWRRQAGAVIQRGFHSDTWRIEHVSLLAQGNVVAGAQLAAFFHTRAPDDYIVFYGCAGALEQRHASSAFLVQFANYLSLGTVAERPHSAHRPGPREESVTLKSKWLCRVRPPSGVQPLDPVEFTLCTGRVPTLDLQRLTGIPGALVAATDKVIRVGPDLAPTPVLQALPAPFYAKEEWTYGQALGLMSAMAGPVLVEMESFGIGRIAEALKIEDRVAILRVTTDTLLDHGTSDDQQADLLADSRALLGRVLLALFSP